MIKKSLIILFCVFIMLCFFGCHEGGNKSATGSEKNVETAQHSEIIDDTPKPLTLDDGIILPPWVEPDERSGVIAHSFYTDNTFFSACSLSHDVVRVKIGNFIRENRYSDGFGSTVFEIKVLESLKGITAGNIYVSWYAYCEGGEFGVELPFYGDEKIVFLEKFEESDEYHIYCALHEYDIVAIDGVEYAVGGGVSRIKDEVDHFIPEYDFDDYSLFVPQVLEKMNEKISFWREKTGREYGNINEYSIKGVYLLSDFISLIEHILNK